MRLSGRGRPGVGIVLMYHRVAEPGDDPWGLCVSPCRFAEQMEVLARGARTVPLAALPEAVAAGRAAVAVTFDDGYADNLSAALPVLERYGIPATVFLATGWVGRPREFWWDELLRLVSAAPPHAGPVGLALKGAPCEWDGAAGRDWLYRVLWRRLRPLPYAEQQAALDAVAAWAGLPRLVRPSHRPLSADGVARLAASPLVEVGAHTVTHPPLAELPPARQAAEIAESRAACEAVAGRPVASFAYPYGSHDARSLEAVRAAGFARALTTAGGAVTRDAAPLAMPRVPVGDWDGEALARRLARAGVA
jgi:peptidoglycan/xylan/chitin deacetylase (PgdA/CDA1 family)